MWTDNFVRRSYITVTFHFIENSKVHAIVLGMKSMDFERSTGINILEKVKTILQNFGVTSLNDLVIVTDRGANMKTAFKDFKRINCSNHLLNNIMEKSFSHTTELDSIINSCKKLTKYFKKASLQHFLDTTLKNHNSTRWNSYLAMFNSIYNNWVKIVETLQSKGEEVR